MAANLPDVSHDCEHGGGATGPIALHQKAKSHCCGGKLAEGGTPDDGFTCLGCGKPCQRVLGDAIAHWTCPCGEQRTQAPMTTPKGN